MLFGSDYHIFHRKACQSQMLLHKSFRGSDSNNSDFLRGRGLFSDLFSGEGSAMLSFGNVNPGILQEERNVF